MSLTQIKTPEYVEEIKSSCVTFLHDDSILSIYALDLLQFLNDPDPTRLYLTNTKLLTLLAALGEIETDKLKAIGYLGKWYRSDLWDVIAQITSPDFLFQLQKTMQVLISITGRYVVKPPPAQIISFVAERSFPRSAKKQFVSQPHIDLDLDDGSLYDVHATRTELFGHQTKLKSVKPKSKKKKSADSNDSDDSPVEKKKNRRHPVKKSAADSDSDDSPVKKSAADSDSDDIPVKKSKKYKHYPISSKHYRPVKKPIISDSDSDSDESVASQYKTEKKIKVPTLAYLEAIPKERSKSPTIKKSKVAVFDSAPARYYQEDSSDEYEPVDSKDHLNYKTHTLHIWRVSTFSTEMRTLSSSENWEFHMTDIAIEQFFMEWFLPGTKYGCKTAKSITRSPMFERQLLLPIARFLSAQHNDWYTKMEVISDEHQDNSLPSSDVYFDATEDPLQQITEITPFRQQLIERFDHSDIVFMHSLSRSEHKIIPVSLITESKEALPSDIKDSSRLCCAEPTHYIITKGCLYIYKPDFSWSSQENPIVARLVEIRTLAKFLHL